MKKSLILFFICSFLLSMACSSSSKEAFEAKAESKESKISIQDQAIIKNYKDQMNSLDLSDRDLVDKTMKESLFEINKIKDNDEREKIQMNIYRSTGMYEEAFLLNTKILKAHPFITNLLTQCELIYNLRRPKQEFEKCHEKLASAFQKELDETSKNAPEYAYSQWGYFLSMYKAGHEDFKFKLEEFINSTKDDQVKKQLESSYQLATAQNNRE